MKKKLISFGLTAAMAVSLLAGATMAHAEEAATLNVALTNPFTGASAINISNPYRFATFSQVYESLVSLNGGEYEGLLLKEWEMTEPGVWALTLHEGITDSQGNPFTSDDVKWALNAQKDAGNDVGRYYSTDCIEVIDDTHMIMHLETDSEGAFYLIAAQLMLCTEEAYTASEDNLATMPVGTGPYVCAEYVEGSSCTLEKRADYWRTEDAPRASAANFDKIEISYVPEATQMAIAIGSGSVDLAGQVNMSVAADADAAEGMKTEYMSNGTYNSLSFNMTGREVSENKALREAVCLAIDSNGLIQGVYNGHAQEMTTYTVSTCIDKNPEWVCNYGYDPELAMEKLKEAGLENGTELVLVSNNVGEDSLLAELVQGYLAGVGINVTIDFVDPATQEARLAEGDWDICFSGGAGVLDMSILWGNFYRKFESGSSRFFHNDVALYELFDAYNAVGGKTDENRQAMYEYESEHLTWYPMFNKEILYAYGADYSGLTVNDAYMSLPYLGTLN